MIITLLRTITGQRGNKISFPRTGNSNRITPETVALRDFILVLTASRDVDIVQIDDRRVRKKSLHKTFRQHYRNIGCTMNQARLCPTRDLLYCMRMACFDNVTAKCVISEPFRRSKRLQNFPYYVSDAREMFRRCTAITDHRFLHSI